MRCIYSKIEDESDKFCNVLFDEFDDGKLCCCWWEVFWRMLIYGEYIVLS